MLQNLLCAMGEQQRVSTSSLQIRVAMIALGRHGSLQWTLSQALNTTGLYHCREYIVQCMPLQRVHCTVYATAESMLYTTAESTLYATAESTTPARFLSVAHCLAQIVHVQCSRYTVLPVQLVVQ